MVRNQENISNKKKNDIQTVNLQNINIIIMHRVYTNKTEKETCTGSQKLSEPIIVIVFNSCYNKSEGKVYQYICYRKCMYVQVTAPISS